MRRRDILPRMAKRLVDIDEKALAAARAELGTKTLKDTVNEPRSSRAGSWPPCSMTRWDRRRGEALDAGEFAPTLNLNVSFARPAKVGRLLGKGRIVRRGKDICFLAAELFQDGELIASGTASAMVRRVDAPSAASR